MSTDEQAQQTPPPVLRVLSGEATPEEIAALTAVLAAAGSAGALGAPTDRRSQSLWKASALVAQPRLAPGRGAWRASGLPH